MSSSPPPANTNFPNPNNYSGFLLWKIANLWEKNVNLELKKIKLNQAEYFLLISLAWLSHQQKTVTQVELANYAGITSMNASKIVNKFEKNSLISRKTGKDTRSKVLLITNKGFEVLISASKSIAQINTSFFPKNDEVEFKNYLNNIK